MKRPLFSLPAFSAAALLTLAPAITLAQQPPNPGGIPGLPRPGQPAQNPTTSLPGQAGRTPDGRIDPDAIAVPAGDVLEFPKATGLEISDLIYKHSGKRVILTSSAKDLEVFFYQRGPMTNREVMDLLSKTLIREGLAIIEDQQDPNIVYLLPSGPQNGLDGQALPYIEDPLDIPVTDELITYRMKFNSLKPEDAINTLQSVVGSLGPAGKIVAAPNASSVFITANSSLIRVLLKVKEDIDKGSLIDNRWVHVIYADVDEIAEQLNEIFNQQRSGSGGSRRTTPTTTRPRGNTPTPPVPGSAANRSNAAAGGGGAGEDIPVNIIPDRRTSRILIIGRPVDIDGVEKMVREFDKPSDSRTHFRHRLRYLRVNDLIDVAESAIERTLGDGARGAGSAGSRRLTGGNQRQTNNRTNQNRNNRTTGQQGGGGSSRGGGGGSLQAQEVPTEPFATTVGRTLLVADNVENAIIVQGPPHHIEIVRQLINELDTASQQVVISAVIGSYALNDNLNFGLDLAALAEDHGSFDAVAGQGRFGGVPSVIDPTTFNNLAGLLAANGAAGNGVSLYGTINDNFGIFLNALETNTNFQTLERPVIATRNNRVATLTSGQRIAIPASSFTGGAANGTTTNVEYRDVVLELEIQPLINSDNEITLEIRLVRDSIGGDRTIGELEVPDLNTETLQSSITVPNGAAIVLGGLITERSEDSQRGVPILSRIPGIGRLFGSTEKGSNRQELVIILRPEIIGGSNDFRSFTDNFETGSGLVQDARESLPRTSTGMLPPPGQLNAPRQTSKSGVVATSEPRSTTPAKKKKKKRRATGFRKRR